jgi:hypothetical protein
MPAISAGRYATYKGKTYRLLYLGSTKYGRRAKLAFRDGSKEFWVAAELVSETSAPSSRSQSRRDREDEECEVCGRNKYTCGHCVGW